jgi:MFS family permease
MQGTRRAETAWPAVAAATLCGIVVAMNIGKLPIALPYLRSEFGLSLSEAGWLAAAFSALAILFGLLIGIIADRFGALRFCLLGLAVSGCGGLLGLADPNGNLLLLSRLIEGLGFLAVSAHAGAGGHRRRRPDPHDGHLGCYAGRRQPVHSPGAALARTRRLARPVVAGADPACGLVGRRGLAAPALPQHQHASPRRHGRYPLCPASAHSMAAHAGLRRLRPAILRRGDLAAHFLQEQRALSPGIIALLSALVIAVNVPGNLAGGALLHHHVNRGRLIAAASLVMGLAGLGIFSEGMPDALRYACCLVLTGVGGMIPVAVLSSAVVLAPTPQQIGTLQGLYLQGSNLGQFAGIPLIAGIVAASGQWQSALVVTASASAVGIVLGLLVARSGK